MINNATLLKQINEKWDDTAPIPFLYERNTEFSKTVSKTLKKVYLEDKPVDKSLLGKLGEVLGILKLIQILKIWTFSCTQMLQ